MQTLKKRQNEQIEKPKSGFLFFQTGTAFFTAIAIFLLLNIGLRLHFVPSARNLEEVSLQANSQPDGKGGLKHSWPWWLTKMYREEKSVPDIVTFGSSLLGSAHISVDAQHQMQLLDTLTHRHMTYLESEFQKRLGKKVSIFSLGSPGQMISDSYLTSRALLTDKMKPRLLIAFIAPRDFVDNTLAFPAVTDFYKFYSRFLNLDNLKTIAFPDFFSRMAAEIDSLPLKRWSKSFEKNVERSLTELDQTDSISRIEPGKSMVPACAVPPRVDNSAEYKVRFKNPLSQNYYSEMEFFKLWLADLHEKGITVLVVVMPTTESNRKLLSPEFWDKFRGQLTTLCKANQAGFLDLSDSGLFKNSDYLDTVHLNAYGAIKLFPVTAEKVALETELKNALLMPDANRNAPAAKR